MIIYRFRLMILGFFCWLFASTPVVAAVDQAKQVSDTVFAQTSGFFNSMAAWLPNTAMLEQALSGSYSWWYILLLAFGTGVLISFTPCVYPMIPITAGILQAHASRSLARQFILSLSYACGIATTYALLGYISATTGAIFGQWMGNPWVIAGIVLFLLYFALSMFGWYEVYVPSFGRTDLGKSGSLGGTFLTGLIAGTMTSPCLTPALALLLGFVAKLGNPLLGFAALFSFAIGLSILLVFVGMGTGMLTMLPKAGLWMEDVKKLFGFLLLGMCVYVAEAVIDPSIRTLGYAAVCGSAVLYFMYLLLIRLMGTKKTISAQDLRGGPVHSELDMPGVIISLIGCLGALGALWLLVIQPMMR